jgi:hypothetical protein
LENVIVIVLLGFTLFWFREGLVDNTLKGTVLTVNLATAAPMLGLIKEGLL